MRIDKKAILMGAAVAAMPLVSQAATVTYQYSGVLVCTTLNGTYVAPGNAAAPGTSLTGTGAAELLTVPAGDFVQFGLQAQVTNNGGAGLYSFDVGFNDTNGASSQIVSTSQAAGTGLANPTIPALYSGAKTFGQYDGAGGVTTTPGIFGGFNSQGATGNQAANGVNFSNLFTKEKITVVAGGTSIFTPIQVNGGTGLLTQAPQNTGTNTANYTSKAFTAGVDTMGVLPTLTIIATGGSTSTTHPIISLTQGTSLVAGYGTPADGSIAMTGKGNGSYNVTPAAGFSTATTGSVLVSGFLPGTDKEIYALKLSQGGSSITNTTTLQAIANDINGTATTNASTGVSASLITGVFATLFPAAQGYDLLITSTGANPADASGNAVLGFDFSSTGEANNPGITVTGVAAVPEPATAVGLVLGAAGLLLGRRKNRMAISA